MNQTLIINICNIILSSIEKTEDFDLELMIKNIMDMVTEEQGLQRYIGDVKFLEKNAEKPLSKGMTEENGDIILFRKGVDEAFEEVLQIIPNFSDIEVVLCKVLLYVKTLLHELEHINQNRLLTEDSENVSFETIITRLCLKEKINSDVGLATYMCLYASYPTERLAELHALRSTVQLVEHLETQLNIPLLACYMKKHVVFEEFYNYYHYGLSGSTEKFFGFLNPESLGVLKAEQSKKTFSLEDRLLYGLAITYEEYEQTVMEYAKLDEEIRQLTTPTKK